MDERKPNGPPAPVLSTQGRRPDSAAGKGSQGGGDDIASAISRSTDALQRARDQRPELGTLIHLATGSREQLDLFAWSARHKPAAPGFLQDAAADAPPARPPAGQPDSERCPSCGAALGTGDEAHSMTGDALADHLLDYHEGELGSAEVSYPRRKEQARCRAQELRRGSVRTAVKTCT